MQIHIEFFHIHHSFVIKIIVSFGNVQHSAEKESSNKFGNKYQNLVYLLQAHPYPLNNSLSL